MCMHACVLWSIKDPLVAFCHPRCPLAQESQRRVGLLEAMVGALRKRLLAEEQRNSSLEGVWSEEGAWGCVYVLVDELAQVCFRVCNVCMGAAHW